jgi:hypothetical protein
MLRLSSLIIAVGLFSAPALAQDEEGDIMFAPDDEQPAEAPQQPQPEPTPAPAPEEAVKVPETPASDAAGEGDSAVQLRVRGKAPDRVFGTYRVRVKYNRPDFDDGMRFYDEAYNKPSDYPSFDADWFAWDWYVTLGLKFGMGYYTDEGHALKAKSGVAKAKEDLDPDDVEEDPNGKTTLTLIPLSTSLTAQMTPFKGKWLVLDGWIGVERVYWQEVRNGAGTATTTAMIQDTATESKDETLTNKGWKNGTVIGAAANILLNPLDEQGANSMRGSMGLGYIYLSPFFEIARSTNKDGVSWGRKIIGLGFTFETVK